jgi:Xaa-Pro aminopeptidase
MTIQFRLNLLKKYLKKNLLSWIFISDNVFIEYLTGIKSSNIYCLISSDKNIICSDFRYKEEILDYCKKNNKWKFLEIKENDFTFLKNVFSKGDIVGFQDNVITVAQFKSIKSICKYVKFESLKDDFVEIFISKTRDEIEKIKKASHIADRAFKIIHKFCRLGITEREFVFILEDICKKEGSQKPSFDTIVLFGKRSALPHGKPSHTRLERGDFVLCDFGCTYDGFASDMTRTFVAGKASDEQKNIYNIVLKAQQEAKKHVFSGIIASEVDNAARSIIKNAGFGEMFGHATGHGVGIRIHEEPRISSNSKKILKPDYVITIEPGIYYNKIGGVRIEDMVVVNKSGCEVITKSPRNLIEVDV